MSPPSNIDLNLPPFNPFLATPPPNLLHGPSSTNAKLALYSLVPNLSQAVLTQIAPSPRATSLAHTSSITVRPAEPTPDYGNMSLRDVRVGELGLVMSAIAMEYDLGYVRSLFDADRKADDEGGEGRQGEG